MNTVKKTVWIYTFEYAGIAKVGGLGEVPANQAKYLKKNFDLKVFIPSHGQIDRLGKDYGIKKLDFTFSQEVDLDNINLGNFPETCKINYYECEINGVIIILLSGENEFTRKYLDDKIVYNPDTFTAKLFLFSMGMRAYVKHLIENKNSELPDLIHMHDYHVVLPFINTKQVLNKKNYDTASLITIHLLTHPKFDLQFYYACGVTDEPIKILLKDGLREMTMKEIFQLCKEGEPKTESIPTMEKIGAVISDLVTTVSNSYLKSDIIPKLGQDLIKFKSDFVWDGCDWDFYEIKSKVLKSLGEEILEILDLDTISDIKRSDMKEYLLTYKIGNLEQSPLINSEKVLKAINQISNGNPFIKNGNIKAFNSSGPLIITTGRMSPQKGFDTIFEAIPQVIEKIPNAKFLLLILPTEFSIDKIELYANYVKQYEQNLRIIFGLAADIFYLAHICSDVYGALSRWEPFGIIALEAMASKLPVIATRVGGLQESIVDLRLDPQNGTGLLIEKESASGFANALISIFKMAEVSEMLNNKKSIKDKEITKYIEDIPDSVLKSHTLLDLHHYDKIKRNCYERVKNNFRWKIVTQKLIKLYKELMNPSPISD